MSRSVTFHPDLPELTALEAPDGSGAPRKKKHAPKGEWKTPPQVFYSAGSASLKKSMSTPSLSSMDLVMMNGTLASVPEHESSAFASGFRRTLSHSDMPFSNGVGHGAAQLMEVEPLNVRAPQAPPHKGAKPEGGAVGVGGVAGLPGSSSCPDLLNIVGSHDNLGESEGERKQKRLARNRASARMRRLRKKTMVETLEAEVEELQRGIELLRSVFEGKVRKQPSSGASRELLGALLGSPGQTMTISSARRKAALQLLMDRQLALSCALQADGLDNAAMIVTLFAPPPPSQCAAAARRTAEARKRAMSNTLAGSVKSVSLSDSSMNFGSPSMKPAAVPGSSSVPVAAAANTVNDGGNAPKGRVGVGVPAPSAPLSVEEIAALSESMRSELDELLQLSDDQRANLVRLAVGLQREQLKLDLMECAALALASHEWMRFPSVEAVYTSFRGVLNAQQVNKFMSWSEKNKAAINDLSLC